MPYKGSKNSIAAEIISILPPAKHFYDIFGGGGAMTHAAALSGKYQYIHYNELNPLICKGFKMAVNGEFKNERRWISREYFHAHKGDDPYVAICWSFGNNLRDYLYSKELEPIKKAVHYARIYNSYCLLHELGLAEPSRAEPSRAEPSRAYRTVNTLEGNRRSPRQRGKTASYRGTGSPPDVTRVYRQ